MLSCSFLEAPWKIGRPVFACRRSHFPFPPSLGVGDAKDGLRPERETVRQRRQPWPPWSGDPIQYQQGSWALMWDFQQKVSALQKWKKPFFFFSSNYMNFPSLLVSKSNSQEICLRDWLTGPKQLFFWGVGEKICDILLENGWLWFLGISNRRRLLAVSHLRIRGENRAGSVVCLGHCLPEVFQTFKFMCCNTNILGHKTFQNYTKAKFIYMFYFQEGYYLLSQVLNSVSHLHFIFFTSQIPNPLFDLAGITCGHFLVPFWTFFGATLIGKAIIKMHIQVLLLCCLFSKYKAWLWLWLLLHAVPLSRELHILQHSMY